MTCQPISVEFTLTTKVKNSTIRLPLSVIERKVKPFMLSVLFDAVKTDLSQSFDDLDYSIAVAIMPQSKPDAP